MIVHLVNRYELREVEETVNIMYVHIEAKAIFRGSAGTNKDCTEEILKSVFH